MRHLTTPAGSAALAHGGPPVGVHDLWAEWTPEPVALATLVAVAAVYGRGRVGPITGRDRWFVAGMVVLALALVSPLDALGEALASAHMAQHVLLASVAAPLLAVSRPGAALLRGAPAVVRRCNRSAQQRLGLERRRRLHRLHPAAALAATTATLWGWHSRAAYEWAVADDLVHAAEHGAFLASGLLLWSAVVRAGRGGPEPAVAAVLLLFVIGLQATFLAALLTFSDQAWYDVYATTTEPWGLDPVTDQRLAGALLWFPSGLVHTGAALWLLVDHLSAEDPAVDRTARLAAGGVGPGGWAEERNR